MHNPDMKDHVVSLGIILHERFTEEHILNSTSLLTAAGKIGLDIFSVKLVCL